MQVGIIAGDGPLPVHVVAGALAAGHRVCVAQLSGHGDPGRFAVPTRSFPIASFGALSKWLRGQGATHVSFAGHVARPDFATLKPDLRALKHMPRVASAARRGDDALLQSLVDVFEREGFTVVAPQDLAAALLAPEGQLGRVAPHPLAKPDIVRACEMAREMGRLDIGQAAVVANGVVLAVEAQEGTAAMLARVADLPATVRGTPDLRLGVLAKMLKPAQDARIDLPTIGPDTVAAADRAGLAGIVVEAGRAFILDRDDTVARADAAGIFVLALPTP